MLAFVHLQAQSFPLLQLLDHTERFIVEVAVIEDNAGGSGWNILLFSMMPAGAVIDALSMALDMLQTADMVGPAGTANFCSLMRNRYGGHPHLHP